MTSDKVFEKNGYILRAAANTDFENYYEQNYSPLDKEVAYLTGSKDFFSKEEVMAFLEKAVDGNDCLMFFLIAPDGRLIGESVINEIDHELRCANFRIAIYPSSERGKGIGTWMVETTRDFAFEELKLHRLELDVYSFNPRAEKAYLKAGFKREGVRRDAILDGNRFADDIIMAMLEDEWREIKRR